ncbi:MAG: hypothetical protein HQL96_17865 [Magnetococcales bacterium]|nr:hypothetical protein [Magnetococcales bacterium]
MDLGAQIEERMEARGRLFATRSDFCKLLGSALCRALGINATSTAQALEAALRTHCQDRIRLVQGGRTRYVARNLPDEAFVREKAGRLGTFTVGQLAMNLPLAKAAIPRALNLLLERGEVACVAIRTDFAPILRWVGAAPPPSSGDNDDERFRLAVQTIGKGGNFVPIHRLRAALGWERERFDRVVRRLQAAERILLNMGDPTRLRPEELEAAFQDANGMLYLTLNWLEAHG